MGNHKWLRIDYLRFVPYGWPFGFGVDFAHENLLEWVAARFKCKAIPLTVWMKPITANQEKPVSYIWMVCLWGMINRLVMERPCSDCLQKEIMHEGRL